MFNNKDISNFYDISNGFPAEAGNCDSAGLNNELQKNKILPTSPGLRIPGTITIQPRSQNDGCMFDRTSQSFSTINCISNPRMQISTLSGAHLLAGVEQLQIQQVIDLSTLLGKSTQGNQYRIKLPQAETILLAVESQSNEKRKMFSYHRGFTMNLIDRTGETIFVIKKQSNMSSSLHKITVESTNLIGSVEQNFTLLTPSFTVYDASRRPLCNICGPNVFGCCMRKESQFQVTSIDGMHHLACLMHKYDSFLHDYTLLLTFPLDTDVKLKNLLLSATFLLDYLYFEHKRQTSRS